MLQGHRDDLEAEVRGLRERIAETVRRLQSAQARLDQMSALERGYRLLVESYEMQLAGLRVLEALDDSAPSAPAFTRTGPIECAT